MEMKPGYKQTEAGVIPDDWEVRHFSDHFKIYAGGDVPKHSLSQTQSESHPYPIFANALQNKGLYGYTAERRSNANSLTITARGYLGHAEYRDDPFFPIVRLLVMEPTGELDARYTTYAVNDRVKFSIESTGVPQLTAPQVGKYFVAAAPTLSEQRAIAAALSDVDGLLSAMDRLIAKKRDLKQAAMQQLLTGRSRLSGFQGKWEKKRFGDVISHCFSGATPRRNRPEYYRGNVRWITSGELNYNVITDTVEKISDEAVAATNLSIIPVGTFLMAITGLEAEGTRGACGIVGKPSATNQSCMAVFPTAALVTNFLFYYYVFRGKQLALQYCQGTKQQSYTARLVKQLPIDLPPSLAEQTAIAKVLADIDAELAALKQRREKTDALKQAMMQELLTGKSRLVPPGEAHA